MTIIDYDYDFYTTDESFDYPSPFGYDYTENIIQPHGITVYMDTNNIISKWSGYGYFDYEISNIKTLQELKEYIIAHLDEIDESTNDSNFTRRELIDELLEFIDENITQAA